MATRVEPIPVPTSTEHPPGWWGMVCVIGTEAALFAYLLLSYFYIGSMSLQWPPGKLPALRLSLPNTVILLASSVVMWWAESGITRGDQRRLRLGLLGAFGLGVIFLIIQGVEYHDLTFSPSSHAYGSLFFTITGFHFAHVAVGLLMMVIVQLRAQLGHFTERHHLAVTNTAMYWHFVDVVWLSVFFSLYITPHLWMHS